MKRGISSFVGVSYKGWNEEMSIDWYKRKVDIAQRRI
jgi:hypothetical protein